MATKEMEVKSCRRGRCSRQLERTVYIEDIFILNLVMNLYLLKLMEKVLGKRTALVRILAGSFMGAAGYCILLVLPGIAYIWSAGAVMFVLGVWMVRYGLQVKGIRAMIRCLGLLYTLAFLLGGFILFLKGKSSFLKEHGSSVMLIAGMGFLGYELIKKGIEGWHHRQKERFCKVYLEGDFEEVMVNALVDTGNGLLDPVSKKPVAVLEEKEWQRLKKWMQPEKYKIIPYHSIGCERGLLEGYEVERMVVENEVGTRQYEKVIIAVLKGKLSKQGGYQMILPPELAI